MSRLSEACKALDEGEAKAGKGLRQRYSEEVVAAFEEDIRFLAKRLQQGETIPTYRMLIRHFKDEHGIAITEVPLRRRIQQALLRLEE